MPRLPNASQASRLEDLLEIATRLFGRRGFHGTSMGDIAGEMGIQKSSLYHWVESKEDLLYQVLSGVLDSLYTQARSVEEAADDSLDFPAKLRRLVALHAQYTVGHPDVMQVFLYEAKWLSGHRGREMRNVRRQYNQLYEVVFYRALERGEISAAKEVIPIYVNLLFSMMNHLPNWFKHEGSCTSIQIADLISDMVLANVSSERE